MPMIRPGQTKEFHVWTGNTDYLFSSTDGIRTFEIWAPIPPTKVRATWDEEVLGGHQWVSRGSENVAGMSKRFSRTVYLAPTENFRLKVKGVTATPGYRRRCYYTVKCSEGFSKVRAINSPDAHNLDTWFAADDYLAWYWAGCTTWVVINRKEKEILLIDSYVSKGTLGARSGFKYSFLSEKVRVANFVNMLRHFVEEGYDIVGVFTSHKHGDHIGDLPYILGGVSAKTANNFLDSGVTLAGKPFVEPIPVVMSADTAIAPFYAEPEQDPNYVVPQTIVVPKFNSREVIDGQDFKVGDTLTLKSFEITPYIWYHGRIGDGTDDQRRVLSYTVKRKGNSPDLSKTFVTTGFCQREEQAARISGTIDCHHLIFAWRGGIHKNITASTASIVNLMRRPSGDNYIFTNHTDMNSMSYNDARSDAIDMFGWLIQADIVRIKNGDTYWKGQKRPIRLGYFQNRIGVDI